ncbi:FAD-binding oxidoreductase [uncultured Roseobacter sp.]|uniref:FAD-binding oxidoreductase n=1 Tax=uncultured Roseobacter sp. TaxID=114847 RepID=UPI00261335C0|nr:FAD-binding oxidoreductase [uncultured Roseobacter sp.]
MTLSGWGLFPKHAARVSAPRNEDRLQALVAEGDGIARGNGRAYGDSAISTENTIHMRHFNRMISFNEKTGVLVAEAGVLAADIISGFLPRGWFLPVTPGTKFVTLGGMIAADVHGKNHHVDGSLGNFIDWIDLMGADGKIIRCSPRKNKELFSWTLGGMGLTGVILRAALRLRAVETGWIRQTLHPTPDLETTIDAFEAAQDATYSVAWIDCLSKGAGRGRSLVMLGEHATLEDLPKPRRRKPFETGTKRKLSVPFAPPTGLMNGWTVRAFNALYYWNGTRNAGEGLVDWDSYFYPLDAILNWNRIYGRRGFAQFQCVLPLESSRQGMHRLLEEISNAGAGSFLAVLKRMGAQESRFSFPMEGYTLALDFPVNRRTLALMTRLDEITLEHGGRFYLAKDSRMTAETLRHSDPRTEDFLKMRDDKQRQVAFMSAQARRLAL